MQKTPVDSLPQIRHGNSTVLLSDTVPYMGKSNGSGKVFDIVIQTQFRVEMPPSPRAPATHKPHTILRSMTCPPLE